MKHVTQTGHVFINVVDTVHEKEYLLEFITITKLTFFCIFLLPKPTMY